MTDTPEGTLVKVNDAISVYMKTPTEDQVTVVAKEAAIAQRRDERAISTVRIFFRVFEALLVNPDDRELFDEGLIDGTVTVTEMTKAFFSLAREEEDDDTPAAPKPRVRTRRK